MWRRSGGRLGHGALMLQSQRLGAVERGRRALFAGRQVSVRRGLRAQPERWRAWCSGRSRSDAQNGAARAPVAEPRTCERCSSSRKCSQSQMQPPDQHAGAWLPRRAGSVKRATRRAQHERTCVISAERGGNDGEARSGACGTEGICAHGAVERRRGRRTGAAVRAAWQRGGRGSERARARGAIEPDPLREAQSHRVPHEWSPLGMCMDMEMPLRHAHVHGNVHVRVHVQVQVHGHGHRHGHRVGH